MSPECGSVRRLVWPPAPQPATAELVEAYAHLERCHACRDFLAEMQAMAQRTRRLAIHEAMPHAARERLFTALARTRTTYQSERMALRGYHRFVLAIGAVIVLTWAWFVLVPNGGSGPGLPISAVAEDHIRGLHQQSIATSDRSAIQRWIGERIPFAVRILDITGARLEGARICFLGGERGVVLRYNLDNRPISYYVMPNTKTRRRTATFQEEVKAGYRVVAWQDGGLTHALVSDFSPAPLDALARSCAEALTTTKESVIRCSVHSKS